MNPIIKNGRIAYGKMLVIGPPGSGKTYFSNALSRCFDGQLLHIDDICREMNAIHLSDEELKKKIARITKEGNWIIDGTRVRILEDRIRWADAIIYLDLSSAECLAGLEKRRAGEEPICGPENYEGFKQYVMNYPLVQKPVIEEMLAKYSQFKLVRLCTQAEVDSFLLEIENCMVTCENDK